LAVAALLLGWGTITLAAQYILFHLIYPLLRQHGISGDLAEVFASILALDANLPLIALLAIALILARRVAHD